MSTSKEDLYADFKDWSPDVQSILQLMQVCDIWALFDHLPASTYCKQRICMSGDAAHASTPHQGAGAAMAIEDAYVLSSLLGDVTSVIDFERAFKAFDAARRERTLKLVKTSRQSGMMFDFELVDIGDDLGRIRENLDTRFHWIWHENLLNEVSKVKRWKEIYN